MWDFVFCRVPSLDGLYLSRSLTVSDVLVDPTVVRFLSSVKKFESTVDFNESVAHF